MFEGSFIVPITIFSIQIPIFNPFVKGNILFFFLKKFSIFLLKFFPSQYSRSLRQCPISFVVGQPQLGTLRAACAPLANVQCAGAPMPFAYGTHHAKLSLYEVGRGIEKKIFLKIN